MEHEAKRSFKAEKQLKKIDFFRIYELGINLHSQNQITTFDNCK